MSGSGTLPEVQALRAIAALAVVLYHIWPDWFPGGYVGVDVFFVISGFVITRSLLHEFDRTGTISIRRFYARRIRRLLPMAVLVLGFSLAGTILFLSPAVRMDIFKEIAASALYVENWVLASASVDYLAATDTPSPVQHYWSLSIEEQFYLFWPLVILGGLWWSRERFAGSLGWVAAIVFSVSLAASIWLTRISPSEAYFVTQTRLWELAAGVLVAVFFRGREVPKAAAVALPVGLAAVVTAVLAFSAGTAFPGYAALVPVAGAVLVIVGSLAGRGYAAGLGFLGDRSYSIYLWHWPLIVFFASDSVSLVEGSLFLVATIAFADVSYRWIEEPGRKHAASPGRTLVAGAVAYAACLVAAMVLMNVPQPGRAGVDPDRYPGPRVLTDGAHTPVVEALVPDPAELKRDLPEQLLIGCHQNQTDAPAKSCEFGDLKSSRTIVLFGDSVAGQWQPALEALALKEGFRLVSMTKSACTIAEVPIRLAGKDGKDYPSCAAWRANAIEKMRSLNPEYIFVSQTDGYGYVGAAALYEGLRSTFETLAAIAKVVVIESTPRLSYKGEDCFGPSAKECNDKPVNVLPRHPLKGAVSDSVFYIDLNGAICATDACRPVVGNIIVWRDDVHLTATYARMLAGMLQSALVD